MTEHRRQADEVERELDDLEEQSEKLEEEIGAARDDWEGKQRDPSVPGAEGDPDGDEENPPAAD